MRKTPFARALSISTYKSWQTCTQSNTNSNLMLVSQRSESNDLLDMMTFMELDSQPREEVEEEGEEEEEAKQIELELERLGDNCCMFPVKYPTFDVRARMLRIVPVFPHAVLFIRRQGLVVLVGTHILRRQLLFKHFPVYTFLLCVLPSFLFTFSHSPIALTHTTHVCTHCSRSVLMSAVLSCLSLPGQRFHCSRVSVPLSACMRTLIPCGSDASPSRRPRHLQHTTQRRF